MKTNKKRSRMLLTVPAIVAVFLAGATICSHTTAKLSQEEETIMPQTVPVLTDLSDLSYTNDLGITDIGDPFMLKVSDDSYYLYCTSAPNGFLCWKSSDMVHWSERKMCYTQEEDSWGRECFWAPEVVYYENTYYMLYTARNAAGRLLLGLAVSEDPAGPFKDIKNEPLFDPGYAVIDGNLLFAPDGSKYLYFSRDCSENTDGVIQKSEPVCSPLK